jgi:hypothetical protein
VDLTVGWPGSVADERVWDNSSLNARLEGLLDNIPSISVTTKASDTNQIQQESVPPFILADSAYPSTTHMVRTFRKTDCGCCRYTKRLNYKLAAIRNCIGNAFGICKGRFRILNHPLKCAKHDVKRAVMLITAIFTLHNFLIDENDETNIELSDTMLERTAGEDPEEILPEDNGDFGTRDILLRHIHWLEEEFDY